MPESGELYFQGIDHKECEIFITNVKKQARAQGKLRDNDWIVDLVSCSMTGKALRWYETLDESVQGDWNLLRKALLDRWPDPDDPAEVSRMLGSVSIVPVPAAAPVAAAPPPPAQITTTTAPLIKGRIRIQTALQSKHIGYISLQEQNQLRITPAARDAMIVRLGTSGNARTLESDGAYNHFVGAHWAGMRGWGWAHRTLSFNAVLQIVYTGPLDALSINCLRPLSSEQDLAATHEIWGITEANELTVAYPDKNNYPHELTVLLRGQSPADWRIVMIQAQFVSVSQYPKVRLFFEPI